MFKISKSKTFRWPIKFTWVSDEGESSDEEITGVFRRLTIAEYNKTRQEIADKIRSKKRLPLAEQEELDKELIRSFLISFEDVAVEDEDGGELTGDALTEHLLDIPNIRNQIQGSYQEAVSGALRTKN